MYSVIRKKRVFRKILQNGIWLDPFSCNVRVRSWFSFIHTCSFFLPASNGIQNLRLKYDFMMIMMMATRRQIFLLIVYIILFFLRSLFQLITSQARKKINFMRIFNRYPFTLCFYKTEKYPFLFTVEAVYKRIKQIPNEPNLLSRYYTQTHILM